MDNNDVLVCCTVELDIVGAPDVRIPGADWLVAVCVGLNDRLNPPELELLWLTGAPAEVETPVLLTAEEMLVIMGVGNPVAVRLTDDDDDDPLSGPAALADRPVEPYGTIVRLAGPVDELPAGELGVVNWYPEISAAVLLPVSVGDDRLTDWMVAEP